MRSILRARSIYMTMLALGYLLLAGSAHAALVDFNTAGDLNTNFFGANSGGATSDNFVEADSIGIGGSRALDSIGVGTGYTTLIYNQASYALANVGDSITVSAFGLKQDDINATNGSGSFLRVGLTDGNNNANNRITGGTGNAIALDVYNNTATAANFTDVIFRYSNKVGSVAFTNVAGGASTLVSGNWYKLTATFTNVDGTNISIAGTLDNYGTDGLTYNSTVRTIAASNFSNAGLIADTTLYGALLARQDGGANAVDDFSITAVPVPEPGTIGLLALGICGLLITRRRAA
jgi:hypothetical protein